MLLEIPRLTEDTTLRIVDVLHTAVEQNDFATALAQVREMCVNLIQGDGTLRKVSQVRPQSSHHLVFKLPMDALSRGSGGTKIALPDSYTRRAVANAYAIFGWVIAASEPYNYLVKENVSVLTAQGRQEQTRIVSEACVESEVRAGDGIMYTSYNRGKVRTVPGHEQLVLVREVDVLATFDMQDFASLELGDIALTRALWPE